MCASSFGECGYRPDYSGTLLESHDKRRELFRRKPVPRLALQCRWDGEQGFWAIAGYGFRVVISSFFADIHKNNELNNFVLPVVVSEDFLAELFASIEADPKMQVEVDLPNQTVTNKVTGCSEKFEINGYKKYCLMNALDDIDFLLENKGKIEDWERCNA